MIREAVSLFHLVPCLRVYIACSYRAVAAPPASGKYSQGAAAERVYMSARLAAQEGRNDAYSDLLWDDVLYYTSFKNISPTLEIIQEQLESHLGHDAIGYNTKTLLGVL